MMTPTSQRSICSKKLHLQVVEVVVVVVVEEEEGDVKAEITLLPSGQPRLSPVRSRNMSRAQP